MKRMYCQCGEPILMGARWNGLAWHVMFTDENNNLIMNCPGCGEWLPKIRLLETPPNHETGEKTPQPRCFPIRTVDGWRYVVADGKRRTLSSHPTRQAAWKAWVDGDVEPV